MNMLSKFWRWITLADVPVNRTSRQCDFCEEPANCYVSINDKSWRTCLAHHRVPVETFGYPWKR